MVSVSLGNSEKKGGRKDGLQESIPAHYMSVKQLQEIYVLIVCLLAVLFHHFFPLNNMILPMPSFGGDS